MRLSNIRNFVGIGTAFYSLLFIVFLITGNVSFSLVFLVCALFMSPVTMRHIAKQNNKSTVSLLGRTGYFLLSFVGSFVFITFFLMQPEKSVSSAPPSSNPTVEPTVSVLKTVSVEELSSKGLDIWIVADNESKREFALGMFGLFILQKDVYQGFTPANNKADTEAMISALITCTDDTASTHKGPLKEVPTTVAFSICALSEGYLTDYSPENMSSQ